MFVSASTICFNELGFPEACQQLADLEFDRVELWLGDESAPLSDAEISDDPEGFVLRYRETTRLTPVAFELSHLADASRLVGLSKAAKLLRVTQLTVPSSPQGTPFNEEIDRLRELVRIVSQDGVRVSISTRIGQLTEDPDTAVELCAAVKGLGLTLDPSHYLIGSRPITSFERFTPYVFHVHLRDSTPTQLQVPVGLGEIDYSRLISQLRREAYDRALSVHLMPSLTDASTRPLELRKLRMLLDSLL